MSFTSEAVEKQLVAFGLSLEGAEVARIVSIACFSLAIYEYMITMDDEMKYFWTGKWDTSRVLFFMNRYFPLLIMIFSIACYSIPQPSPEPAIQLAFLSNVVAITVIQGILVVRIWYLFQGNKRAQIGIIIGFVISVILSVVFIYLSADKVAIITQDEIDKSFPNLRNEGCKAARPPDFWHVYLPSLILHTAMYIMTGIRALRNRRLLKDSPILKRLLRDGGFFYFVVFFSVILTAVGSMLKQYPLINIPAIYSYFLLTTTSVAVSRVLFSIHSLAHKLGSDSAWLLNNVELSRVGWRMGAHEGEIIVESFTAYADDDLESTQGSISSLKLSVMKETRVGVYGEDSYAW